MVIEAAGLKGITLTELVKVLAQSDPKKTIGSEDVRKVVSDVQRKRNTESNETPDPTIAGKGSLKFLPNDTFGK